MPHAAISATGEVGIQLLALHNLLDGVPVVTQCIALGLEVLHTRIHPAWSLRHHHARCVRAGRWSVCILAVTVQPGSAAAAPLTSTQGRQVEPAEHQECVHKAGRHLGKEAPLLPVALLVHLPVQEEIIGELIPGVNGVL